MAAKRTMTINLTAAEMEALDEMASTKEMTKTALVRQALRLYHAVDRRLASGEKLFFEDELEKKAELVVL